MSGITERFGYTARAAAMLAVTLLASGSATSAQEKAMGDGVKVHGHWTIDVKNADGSLASHRDFENALLLTRQDCLSLLLSHQATFLGWGVGLEDGTNSIGYFFAEPAVASAFGVTTSPLAVTTTASKQVVLQGTVQAPFSMSVSVVETNFIIQLGPTRLGPRFSGRTLSQAIPVEAGQTVQVSVVFSFS
jgi:hypothetical protein